MSYRDEFLALRREYIEKRFSALNVQQRTAALSCDGASLILAGAGSGKTTVIVNRILCLLLFGNAYESDEICYEPDAEDIELLRYCLQDVAEPDDRLAAMLKSGNVQPWNILAITFTNKAASQLKERITRAVGPEGNEVFASTFHSACVRFLRRNAQLLGWPQSFTIYDSDDSERVVKDIYKAKGIDDKLYPVRWMTSCFGRIKDSMLTADEYLKQSGDDPRARKVHEVFVEYQARLKASGAFDFDDLIYFTVRLLEQNEDVRNYYHRLFRYVMVDEYQDTSRAQYMLVKLLTNENNNIFVVGDDDQSIYSFRGATIENILNFESDFAPAKVIRLEQNYRSTANILQGANSVIRNNRGRKGKELWTSGDEGEKIHVHVAENEQDEAVYISSDIFKHTSSGTPLSAHAVLYRTNAQSAPVETYFARAGVPYKIVGALRFYDRAEIKDVISYLSVVSHPADDLRLKRIINRPARKIGDTTVERIEQLARERGVPMLEIIRTAEAFPELSRAASALKGFYNIYKTLRECYESMPLGDFAEKLLDITGYRDMLTAMGSEGEPKLENVNEFLSAVRLYEQDNPDGDLAAFLEEIALVSNMDNYDETSDRVSLMTIHSAKGLEFDYVYIIGMEDGVFPLDRARMDHRELEEERRLAYVGMTRAKKQLHLIRAQMRMLYGMTRRNPPSQFLQELDMSCCVESGEQERRPQAYLDRNYNRASSQSFGSKSASFSASSSFGKSAEAPAAPKQRIKPNTTAFYPGDLVNHRMFGTGRIISATPIGGDVLLEIDFDRFGRKKAMANYAPMEKLED